MSHSSDLSNQFNNDMLQIISEVIEPLNEKIIQDEHDGCLSQAQASQGTQELSLKEVKLMFEKKLDEKAE